ncbi:MAG: hypothetical protein AAF497_20815 [Planctomycetota bacterium]
MTNSKTTERQARKGSILLDCVGGLILTGIALTTMALGLANISFQRKAQFNRFVAQQSLANALEDVQQQTQSRNDPQFDAIKLDDWAVDQLPSGKLKIEESQSDADRELLRTLRVEVQWQGPGNRPQRQSLVFPYPSSYEEDSEQ